MKESLSRNRTSSRKSLGLLLERLEYSSPIAIRKTLLQRGDRDMKGRQRGIRRRAGKCSSRTLSARMRYKKVGIGLADAVDEICLEEDA